jgi:hypothetical protein
VARLEENTGRLGKEYHWFTDQRGQGIPDHQAKRVIHFLSRKGVAEEIAAEFKLANPS